MNLHRASNPTLDLMPGQPLRLPRLSGPLLVLSGRIWLTCTGDPADHFLGPGEPWPLGRRRGVVIECDGPAVARVRLPLASRPAGLWLSAGSAACR